MTALLLFLSTFGLVFLLGVQSQFVNRGRALPAFFISFFIGAGNLLMLKLAPNASPLEMAAYMSGGPIGIVCAIHFFAWLHKKKNERLQ